MKARRIFAVLAAVAVMAAVVSVAAWSEDEAKEMPSVAIDKPAPDFTLKDIDGKKHKLSEYKGKYVVLEWNNMDCPFVKKHYDKGNMQALQKKYGEKDVVWLTICSSAPGNQGHYDADAMKKRTKKSEFASAAYLQDGDGTVGRMYDAKTTPHMYVINPRGVLIYAGAIDDKPSTKVADLKGATNYVQSCLDAAMAGKDVAVKTSAPYGCNVKYAKNKK